LFFIDKKLKNMFKKLIPYCFLFVLLQNVQAQYATLRVDYGNVALGGQDSTRSIYAAPAAFGAPVPYSLKNILGVPLVFPKDLNDSYSICDSIPMDLTGRMALIDKAGCGTGNNSLVRKCYRALQKGASAVLIANDSDALETPLINSNDPQEVALAKAIYIPCLLLPKKEGIDLRNYPPSLPLQLFQLNNNPLDASPMVSGTTILTDEIIYGGVALDSLSANSTWFKFTAPRPGGISLRSCLRGVNTHVAIYMINNNQRTLIAENDSACPMSATDNLNLAAALDSVPVEKGKTYYIAWDDRWSSQPFLFDFKFKPNLNFHDVTFEVFVSNPNLDGVHLAGSFQGWDPAKTLMNLDAVKKIWSITIPLEKGIYQYKYINGNQWGQDENVVGFCVAPGSSNRSVTISGPTIIPLVCLNECTASSGCIEATSDLTFASAFQLAPNPTQGNVQLNYHLPNPSFLQIRISNLLGEIVAAQSIWSDTDGNIPLNIESLQNGLYSVNIYDGKMQTTKKLVLNRQ
jgi:hypothetical protein